MGGVTETTEIMKKYLSFWTSVSVTMCRNKYTAGKEVELRKILTCIPEREYNRTMLMQLWNTEGDENKQAEIKGGLPIWFPGGVFGKSHELFERKTFSNLLCLDIDGKDNPDKTPEEIKQLLSEWRNEEGKPYVGYAGLSCRRHGVFALIRVPNKAQILSEYRKYYAAIEEEIRQQYGIVIDERSSNPAQARFISLDYRPIFNEDPAVWCKQKETGKPETKPITPRREPPKGEWRKSTIELLEYIVQAAEYAGEPLFYTEKEWWQLCNALTSNLGEAGRDLFVRLSNVWSNALGEAQKIDPDRFYTDQMRTTYSASIGFIINRAKAEGLLK